MIKTKLALILIAVIFGSYLFGQERINYQSGNRSYIRLSLDFQDNTYLIWEDSGYDNTGDTFIAGPEISKGRIKIENNRITCIENNTLKKIFFKRIDKYRLSTDEMNCFFKKDVLYATQIATKEKGVTMKLSWKKDKKHGQWTEYLKHGVRHTLYDNGKIIKTDFKTYQELREERLNQIRLYEENLKMPPVRLDMRNK